MCLEEKKLISHALQMKTLSFFCWKLTITHEKIYTEITTKQEGRLGEAKHGSTRKSQYGNNKKLLQFVWQNQKNTKTTEFPGLGIYA